MPQFLLRLAGQTLGFIGFILTMGLIAPMHPKMEAKLFTRGGGFGNTHQRIPEFKQKLQTEGIELLFLGSSTCYRGINPVSFEDKLGMTTFNLCSSSQALSNSSKMLGWLNSSASRTKAIVLDVYPALWNSSGVECARDIGTNHNTTFDWTIARIASSSGDPFTVLNALYFGSKALRGIDSQFSTPRNGDDYRGLGFTWSNHHAVEPVKCLPISVSLNPTQMSGLSSIRETCEEKGIKLLLVNPPQLCEEVFEKPEVMEGLPWIEGNDWPLAKVDTLYYDDHHLRGVGAELYSEWLAEKVEAVLTHAPATTH